MTFIMSYRLISAGVALASVSPLEGVHGLALRRNNFLKDPEGSSASSSESSEEDTWAPPVAFRRRLRKPARDDSDSSCCDWSSDESEGAKEETESPNARSQTVADWKSDFKGLGEILSREGLGDFKGLTDFKRAILFDNLRNDFKNLKRSFSKKTKASRSTLDSEKKYCLQDLVGCSEANKVAAVYRRTAWFFRDRENFAAALAKYDEAMAIVQGCSHSQERCNQSEAARQISRVHEGRVKTLVDLANKATRRDVRDMATQKLTEAHGECRKWVDFASSAESECSKRDAAKAHHHLAEALLRQGNKSGAEEEWTRAIALDETAGAWKKATLREARAAERRREQARESRAWRDMAVHNIGVHMDNQLKKAGWQ